MKIALISDDGLTISKHFGRALSYVVLTVEDGKITNREVRSKLGHNHLGGGEHHHHEQHGEAHGLDAASHDRHARMADAISDCEAVLCGGMGRGAYESMRRLNIKPIVTDIDDVETAAQAYINGQIIDRTDLLH